jgi:hypothetical protein
MHNVHKRRYSRISNGKSAGFRDLQQIHVHSFAPTVGVVGAEVSSKQAELVLNIES